MDNKIHRFHSLRLQFSLILFMITVIISSIIMAVHQITVRDMLIEDIKIRLLDIAGIAARQIDTSQHEKIKDTEDEKKKGYLSIKKKLQQIRDCSTDIRFIYTMIMDHNGAIRIIVDAETDPLDIAHPGTVYNDATSFLRKNFKEINNPTAENKIYTDRWGTWLSGYAPFYTPEGKHAGLVGVDIGAEIIAQKESDLMTDLLILFLILLPLSLITGSFFGTRMTNPIKKIIAGSEIISGGNLDYIIKINNKTEIGVLAESFNQMTKRLRALITKLSNEIQDRVEAERLLIESEEKFRALTENSYDTIMRFDRDFRHLYVNKIVEKQTGISASKFIGKTHKELGFPENLIRLWEPAIKKVFDTGERNRIEFCLPQGAWMDWLLVPEKNEFGEVKAVITSARDITEIKKNQNDINKTRNYLKNIIDSLSFMLVSVDSHGSIMEWNRAAETFYGRIITEKSTVWEYFPFLNKYKKYIIEENKQDFPRAFIEKATETGLIFEIKFHKLNYDSNTGTVIFIDNITEQEKRDSLLRQAQKMESIGNLSGGLAHDFNNVLGGVSGTASILRNELEKKSPDYSKIKKYIITIQKASMRASELVSQLLSLSRKKDYSFQNLDLATIIKEVIQICTNTFDKSVEFHILFPEDIDTSPVKGDPSGLQQVFLNLFINSMHALTIMRDENEQYGGIIKVTLEKYIPNSQFRMMLPEATFNLYWKVEVQDTGVGMSQEVLSQIFDPFFSTKNQGQGTGLGLAMVYNIIEQHKGFIDVYSTPGLGSTFIIYLPPDIEDIKIQLSDEVKKRIYKGNGLIMIVDDEELMRETAGFLLEECGYDVIFAENGEKAISQYLERDKEISAVLLDLSMPKLSGLQTFEELKKINNNVKALLSSGLATDERIGMALEAGVKDFLKKPFDLEELSEKIYNILHE